MEQRSPEWYAARLGKVTASRVADLMAKTKSGYSTSRANYMAELICERLTGQPTEGYTNSAMQWGIDTEPRAKAAYSFTLGEPIVECAFAVHDKIPSFGASPDGLVGDDGLLEIKCPNSATHIETLLRGGVEGKYFTQMQAQLACTGRKWCDFVSFDPRLPAEMQIFLKRIERDDAFIEIMEGEITSFLGELDGKVSNLRTHYGVAA